MSVDGEGEADKVPVRLQVALARSGVASRRACEALILSGRISVNGVVVRELGSKVINIDRLALDGKELQGQETLRYFMLNKPLGYLCTMSDDQGRPVAIDLFRNRVKERIYNVGRLDFSSSGLILFTNDGTFAKRLGHPSGGIDKEYAVFTDIQVPESLPAAFVRGIDIEGDLFRAERVDIVNERELRIVLLEGRNREIRRVLEAQGLRARKLTRIRIGPLELGNLREGEYRELEKAELDAMEKYVYKAVHQ